MSGSVRVLEKYEIRETARSKLAITELKDELLKLGIRARIKLIHKRYRELRPQLIPEDFKNLDEQPKLQFRYLQTLPELQENPFRRRLCEVFSENGDGSLTFDNFLNMMSVFCDTAPRELKTKYAFKIFDFDGDQQLGKEDLQQTVRCITGSELAKDEVEYVVERLLNEADLNEDGFLSYVEFEKVMDRAPEFMNNFHIHI